MLHNRNFFFFSTFPLVDLSLVLHTEVTQNYKYNGAAYLLPISLFITQLVLKIGKININFGDMNACPSVCSCQSTRQYDVYIVNSKLNSCS